MMSFSSDLAREMARLQRTTYNGVNAAMDALAAQYKTDIEKAWPDTSRPVHIYATGRSRREFYLRKWSRVFNGYTLFNDAEKSGNEYAGYTDAGYTTKGPQTARSFRSRRARPTYTRKAWDANASKYSRLVNRIFRSATRG